MPYQVAILDPGGAPDAAELRERLAEAIGEHEVAFLHVGVEVDERHDQITRKLAEHDAIFAQQPWYTVDERYTDNKLSLVELENIRLADKPPPLPPPKPPQAGFGKVEDQPLLPPPQIEPRTCGCTSAPLQVAWMGLPLLLLGLRRRG